MWVLGHRTAVAAVVAIFQNGNRFSETVVFSLLLNQFSAAILDFVAVHFSTSYMCSKSNLY